MIGTGNSMGVVSTGAELAGTVTVMVLAEVTVTVAGPHSPPADVWPTGELPRSLVAPALDSTGESPLAVGTGSGTTVTTDVRTGLDVTGAEPVGAMVVVLPWPYGAVDPAVGNWPGGKIPEDREPEG